MFTIHEAAKSILDNEEKKYTQLDMFVNECISAYGIIGHAMTEKLLDSQLGEALVMFLRSLAGSVLEDTEENKALYVERSKEMGERWDHFLGKCREEALKAE